MKPFEVVVLTCVVLGFLKFYKLVVFLLSVNPEVRTNIMSSKKASKVKEQFKSGRPTLVNQRCNVFMGGLGITSIGGRRHRVE